jgi:peptidoglycan/LPS O-acetylase OafA/YrhL
VKRFEALDGLRGLAALFVVWTHGCQFFHLDSKPAHGYLAVDFFFCLSGFVIASAYDLRLDTGMSRGDFCTRRFIRLYPMIALGVLLGGVATYINLTIFHDMSVFDCLLFTVSAFALLPVGLLKHLQAYPVNNPIWSLAFETFANVAYVIERKGLKIGWWLMAALIVLSLVALVFEIVHQHGVESIGFNRNSFLMGFARVLFPFLSAWLFIVMVCTNASQN